MSTPPIRIPITADDQYSAALSVAQAKVRSFGAESGLAGEKMRTSFHEAKGAAALLGEEVGVKLNRHLRSVLASSQLIGPILNAAFPIVAAVGFLEVLEHIPDVIKSATDSLAGFTEKSQASLQDAIKNNERLLTSFKDISKGYIILQELQKNQLAASGAADKKSIFGGLGEAYAGLGVIGVISKIRDNIKERNALIDKSLNLQDLEVKVLERQNVLWEEKKKKAEEYGKKVEAAAKRLDETQFRVRQESTKVSPSISTTGNHIDTFTDLLAMQAEPNQEIAAKYLKHFQDLQAVFAETRRPAELLAISIQNLNDLFRGDTTSETYKRALENIKDRYDEARQAAERFGQEVGHALAEGILMGRSWKNVLDSLIIAFAQLIVKMYLLKALQDSSFGSSKIGGFFTSLVSGFGGGKAGGGPVSGGMPYLVGEKGPEIFMPNTSGSIVPNGRFGGGGNVFNIDARGAEIGVEQKIVAAMNYAIKTSVAQSVGIVRENSLRGRG